MDAIAVVMIGAGCWIMYAAYKKQDPLQTALGILKTNTGGSTVAPTGTSTAPDNPTSTKGSLNGLSPQAV